MKRHIPNFLTCCNLVCGTLGIFYLFKFDWVDIHYQNVPSPAYFVWAACLFDFLDGFVARLLKVHSPIGKELDSLADLISFGLLPTVFMYHALEAYTANLYMPFASLLIVVFSALRLAKFNIDETQSDSFKGLPTPANALFITGLLYLDFLWNDVNYTLFILLSLTLVFSALLVSNIELFALKFKDFSWRANKTRFTFLILSVLLIAFFNFAAIPLVVILYILFSLGLKVSGING